MRRAVVGLGERHLGIGALERLPLIPSEERLGRLGLVLPEVRVGLLVVVDDRDDRRRTRVVVGVDGLGEGGVAVGIAVRPLPVDVELRQQQAAGLRLDLERGLAAGVRLADHRVVLDGVLIDIEQVIPPGSAGDECAGNTAGQDEHFDVHRGSPSGGGAAQG